MRKISTDVQEGVLLEGKAPKKPRLKMMMALSRKEKTATEMRAALRKAGGKETKVVERRQQKISDKVSTVDLENNASSGRWINADTITQIDTRELKM